MPEHETRADMTNPNEPGVAAVRLRFALGFGAIAGALFGVYTFPYQESGISERWFTSYLSAYAYVAGSVLSLFEPNVVVHGQEIIGRTSLDIVKSCDAMEVEILFAAAVLAFPSPWRRRLLGVVVGIVAIAAVNVLRIGSLYYVGIHFPGAFEFAHLQLFPLLLVASAVATFLLWASWARPLSHGDAHVF